MSSVVFNNVHLNFSFDSDSLAPRIETILYLWARQDLADVFDSVFDDYDVDDTDIHLEDIDFDLGDIPENNFLSETCSRLKEKLEQVLFPKIEKQRRATYLKILINACKKHVPEIQNSEVEKVFSSVYQAEKSKEAIFKKAISILKKNYPTISSDEITDDVFNELNFLKGKKKNVYLLKVLEKIYSSFFSKQQELFIHSFFTSTLPHHFSDGYLDLLKHFVFKMQEKHPNFNGIQKIHSFNHSDDKNAVNLKQILTNICAVIPPSDSSAFIDDFIRRTKASKPFVSPLGIIILFIDELKKKYPHLNEFRLSNFDEDSLPSSSRHYWKSEIREILWNTYKSILQTDTSDFEDSTFEDNKQDPENASISAGTQNKAKDSSDILERKSTHNRSTLSRTSDSENSERKSPIKRSMYSGTSDSKDSVSEDAYIPEHKNPGNSNYNDSPFEANNAQIQASKRFDSIFNECFAESPSQKRKSSPLQITESFISKLHKKFPNQAVFDNALNAYQKATELEIKYNSARNKDEEILVKDAGLVLIGAYVPSLFKKLEYTADGVFASERTRLKACRLLRYIVFGDLPSDGLYFLANYFCGLPWNFRIPDDIILDDNEKNVAESLIKSVIENWNAIGHVSIDGFRGTFLHRDGKIEKEGDDEIHLKVKKGPFDMLLDRLPWPYSMLKFKWHKKLLSTTWR